MAGALEYEKFVGRALMPVSLICKVVLSLSRLLRCHQSFRSCDIRSDGMEVHESYTEKNSSGSLRVD